MREPAFWWREPGLPARLLMPVAACYGAVTAARLRRSGAHAGIPVICVGNWTHGGTGKTPAAIAIARLLAQDGRNPFFLSRGYGGTALGPLRVEPTQHRADEVGDEPLLLARQATTIVSPDRVAGGRMARDAGADVLVMDDGLQNPSLAKDLTIAVLDGMRGIGNGAVFPAGPLRAPLEAQIEATDAILIIGQASPGVTQLLARLPKEIPVLAATLRPDATTIETLRGRRLLAYAGIGAPQRFFDTLAAAGLAVAATESFDDHHPYSVEDARRLIARCEREGLVPVTTEKDIVRLEGPGDERDALAARSTALPVTLVFEVEGKVRALLRQALGG
jgi:tetraacyldisaccharide 4'-kinase